jgi:hypothetical protein
MRLPRLDYDLPSDQNDAIVRQAEEVADVYGVSLHRDIVYDLEGEVCYPWHSRKNLPLRLPLESLSNT